MDKGNMEHAEEKQTIEFPGSENLVNESPTLTADIVQSNHKPAPKLLPMIQQSIRTGLANYKEWRFLQKNIHAQMDDVDYNVQKIFASLCNYRIHITAIKFKAAKIDTGIWDQYNKILEDINFAKAQTLNRQLYLRSRIWLLEMNDQWKNIQKDQKDLLDTLEKAPSALEFYNRMQIVHQKREAERTVREENNAKIEEAKKSLFVAISNVEKLYDEERTTYTSKLLSLEDAEQFWGERLNEIVKEEETNHQNVEDIVYQIYTLENVVRNAPSLVLRIRDIEERLTHIISIHDLLIANGKSVISQKEMVRISGKLYEQVPRLWATGQRSELEHTLETLENFLSSYENSVENELYYLERRRPGLTRALSTPAADENSNGLLFQLTILSRSLVNAIDARDHYMRGHSEGVARLSVQIAQKLNWNQTDLDYLYVAGMLHDVGKISIPESILSKTQPLTPEEWRIVQMHPYFGAQIIKPIDILARIVPWVYHHQERWDGTGYPDHLVKSETPMGASIIALAEAYTVMIIDLPYRTAISKEEAIDICRKNSGAQFCPEVVDAFLQTEKL